YDLFRHAEWYGLTLLDFIFPAFLTIFGILMAIAYDRKIKWYKVGRRTILLILFGLLFNMIVSWNFSLSDVRYTGVLQFLCHHWFNHCPYDEAEPQMVVSRPGRVASIDGLWDRSVSIK